MTTAVSTQGRTVRIDSESALGTADNGIDKDILLAAAPTLPPITKGLHEQPNIGYENASTIDQKPIPYTMPHLNAITLPVNVRRGVQTNMPTLMRFLQALGMTVTSTADGRVNDAAAAVGDWDMDANPWGDASNHYGGAVLVQMTSNTWYPALLASFTHATLNAIPLMDLPTAPKDAASTAKRMYTATVNPAPLDATDTLTIVDDTRGDEKTYNGCACGDLGEIVISGDGLVTLSPTFHYLVGAVGASALNAESLLDGGTTAGSDSHAQLQNSSNFRCEVAAFDPAGGVTAATLEIESATIRPNITTEVIPGYGSTSCVSGVQSYMSIVGRPEVDLVILKDRDYINNATKGIEVVTGNQDTIIQFVWQTTSLEVTSSLISLPNCYQYAPPDIDYSGNKEIMTLHFRANAPKFTGSATSNGSTGMSPIYIAIHGQSA